MNKFNIFEYPRRSMEDVPGKRLDGIRSYDKWKL